MHALEWAVHMTKLVASRARSLKLRHMHADLSDVETTVVDSCIKLRRKVAMHIMDVVYM